MVKMVVCIKQVPMVSELPWDPATGTLQRDLAEGMMNPACRAALEAALRIREAEGGEITAITMGPPMAEEVLREAIALGADRGVLLTDRQMAGADTSVTSFTLARAIEKTCPEFRSRPVRIFHERQRDRPGRPPTGRGARYPRRGLCR